MSDKNRKGQMLMPSRKQIAIFVILFILIFVAFVLFNSSSSSYLSKCSSDQCKRSEEVLKTISPAYKECFDSEDGTVCCIPLENANFTKKSYICDTFKFVEKQDKIMIVRSRQ